MLLKKCKHEWFYLNRQIEFTDSMSLNPHIADFQEETLVYIYCPKCECRKKVKEFEWELIKREQEIQREYYKIRKRLY